MDVTFHKRPTPFWTFSAGAVRSKWHYGNNCLDGCAVSKIELQFITDFDALVCGLGEHQSGLLTLVCGLGEHQSGLLTLMV